MILYKLNLDNNGYNVKELSVEHIKTGYTSWYEAKDQNFTVLAQKCYSQENYDNNQSIHFEHEIYSWDNYENYVAYSLVRPDEKIKEAFLEEIRICLDTRINVSKEQLDDAARRYDCLCKEKEKFDSFITSASAEEIIDQDEELEM